MDFFSWVIVSTLVAVLLISRHNKKIKQLLPQDINPVIYDEYIVDNPINALLDLKNNFHESSYDIYSFDEKMQRLIIEDKSVGLFHWGFLYTIDAITEEDALSIKIGVFPKGVNPPKTKALKKYLENFVSLLLNNYIKL